jgi:nitrate/nitrite-specific signal transduction histidine kinase
MSNNQIKRRTIFIDKAFQGRFILSVLLLILLSAACSALLVYWLAGGELQAQSQTAHINIMNALEHIGISILIGNLAALLIAGGVSVFIVLYSSHKIAGPLYRFEKLCQNVGDGQLDTITSLREDDQLQDMGKAFADMVTKLRSRKDQRVALVTELTSHLEQLRQDQAITDKHSGKLEQMQQALKRLQE